MILEAIKTPQDIKELSPLKLAKLAEKIREKIISVLSTNGGHLGSNLGTVELILSLHKVFDSPKDKFIFDVSHQAYTHKILTGRNSQFETLGKMGGLSGFTHPAESPHDHFHLGHAGTALSQGLGLAHTRDLNGESNYILPIIGDATLTCGMSLEALNNIPPNLKHFIVVLNDNAMSISKNVGVITNILSRLISNPTTHKLHEGIHALISKIPGFGKNLSRHTQKAVSSLKNLVSPAAFFELYGLHYIGPIDGHDIKKLVDTFNDLKSTAWPVIVHVLTQKGRGLEPAVKSPVTWHGVKPFDRVTGKFLGSGPKKETFPSLFGKEILKMAEEDPSLVAVTPAMLAGSCLDPFIEKFPTRCLDVGIAEGHSVTFAGALALDGSKKVVASIYATFLQRALDNLFHDVCLQEIPVLFAIDRAGLAPYGGTHHGIYDISFLNAMPNMVIAQPRNGKLLRELLRSAFHYGKPCAIRYPNVATEEGEGALSFRPEGKAEVLREGSDLLILGVGQMNELALELHQRLKARGIEATVVDPIFVKPLDQALFKELLSRHQTVVTIEEHSVQSGFGAIFNHFLMSHKIQGISVFNFGIPEQFIGHGSHGELLHLVGLTADKIEEAIVKVCTTAETR